MASAVIGEEATRATGMRIAGSGLYSAPTEGAPEALRDLRRASD